MEEKNKLEEMRKQKEREEDLKYENKIRQQQLEEKQKYEMMLKQQQMEEQNNNANTTNPIPNTAPNFSPFTPKQEIAQYNYNNYPSYPCPCSQIYNRHIYENEDGIYARRNGRK